MIYFSNIFPLSVNDNVFPSPKSRLENDICCLPSGTTLNLHESIDFVHWVRIHLLSLTQTCIFFVFYDQTSTFFIKISAILLRKLHVIYSYFTSSSLLAGGLHAVLRIFIILLRKIYRNKYKYTVTCL
jgi:hypothetical protein